LGRRARYGSQRPTALTQRLTIRLAKRNDFALMASLSRREVEHGLPWSWKADRIGRFMKLPSTNAYIAEFNGQFAGFSIASLGEVRAHLVLLATEKRWQNQGVGRELLNWQIRAAQTAGLTDMSLEVRAANNAAQRFYAAANFRKVRLLPRYYSGVEDAIRFRLAPIRVRKPDFHKNSPAP